MRLLRHEDESTPDVGALESIEPPSLRWSTKPRPRPVRTVEEVMRQRPLTVPGELPLESVLQLLAEEGARRALVVNGDDDLIGVLAADDAERLLDEDPSLEPSLEELRGLIGDAFHLESVLTAADAMQPYVKIARPSWPAARALALMEAEGADMLPVIAEGDGQPIGIVCRSDLEEAGERGGQAPRIEPYGTYRDGLNVAGTSGRDRRWLMEQAEQLASSWLQTRPVEADAPTAITFTGAMLPLLSELYEDLVEHYSDFQEGPLFSHLTMERPELVGRAERLRLRQADALAVLPHLMKRIRSERCPSRDCLRSVRSLSKELKAIEEAESDLLYEAHWVDLAAAD